MATLAALTHGSHDVKWADVVRLVAHLGGSVEDHGHNKSSLRIGDQRVIFAVPAGKSLSSEQMAELKQFLRRAGVDFLDPARVAATPAQATETAAPPWVVVVDHHVARIYYAGEGPSLEPLGGAVRPHDPHGFLRHLIHRQQTRLQGQRSPEDHAFYEQIAHALADASAIILVGHATGKSSAATFLMSHLEHHHPTIAERVIRQEDTDLSALTDSQIEALALRYRMQ